MPDRGYASLEQRRLSLADPFNLERFVAAQDPIYHRVIAELRRGMKQTHWMWFVFPQIAGLGRSAMAERHAISSLEEARAYLAHRLLGPRLLECTQAVLDVDDRGAHAIFGSPDDVKFHSSMTLFAHTANNPEPFRAALDKHFGGKEDVLTIQKI
jgi:uncharacterized protein (DUF1810 family)